MYTPEPVFTPKGITWYVRLPHDVAIQHVDKEQFDADFSVIKTRGAADCAMKCGVMNQMRADRDLRLARAATGIGFLMDAARYLSSAGVKYIEVVESLLKLYESAMQLHSEQQRQLAENGDQ